MIRWATLFVVLVTASFSANAEAFYVVCQNRDKINDAGICLKIASSPPSVSRLGQPWRGAERVVLKTNDKPAGCSIPLCIDRHG